MRNPLALIISISLMVMAAMAAPAQAQLSYHGIESTINDDMSVSSKITLKFSGSVSELEYITAFPLSKLKVGGNFGPVSCSDSLSGDGSKILCQLSGITKDKNTLYLEFESKDMVNYSYGRYHFDAGFVPPLNSEKFFYMVKLPESATLAGYPANTSYNPSYGTTITDGLRIMVFWDSSNITTGQQLDFRIEYNLPPIRGAVTRYILIGAGAIILIVIAIAFLYTRRASRFNKSSAIASVLNADEKRVVDIVTAGGSGALQKHIVRESGFSKAKVSRLVKSLGGRGVIKVEPVSGRENRILLASGKEKEKREESKEGDNNGGNKSEKKDSVSQA